ncbi:MAG TPA: hypothetical protein VFW50_11980 [Streptosporangiaceae bacterium]|nr:hypothetical protein [Streptosporangiaceae bacterium]
MESELINDAARYAQEHVDTETLKFLVSVAMLVVPVISDHVDIEIIREFDDFTADPIVGDLVEAGIDNAIDLTAEITKEMRWQKDARELDALEADILEADLRQSEVLEAEIREAETREAEALEAGIRADAEKAAAVIEELTVELAGAADQAARESEQAIMILNREFAEEQQELAGKLDKMENAYFDKHPDLDAKQRDAAEDRFEDIRKEEMESLGSRQDARLTAVPRSF